LIFHDLIFIKLTNYDQIYRQKRYSIWFLHVYSPFECGINRTTMSKYLYYITRVSVVVMLVFSMIPVCTQAQVDRPIDGFGYNTTNPHWGSVEDVQTRLSYAEYKDGISIPVDDRPNPRRISNILFAQTENIGAKLSLSDYTWVFGQFVDHDIVLTENNHEILLNIVVPEDDEHFIPGDVIFMSRNEFADGTGVETPRQHVNRITAFLDLSNVYGSDIHRATWLRSFEDGKLKVSERNLLPWNTTDGHFNSPVDPNSPFMADDTESLVKMYVAGDVRANENPLLISFHTLFVREHNRLCDEEKIKHPGWNDERLYQAARKKNIAIYQKIVFDEWLPSLGINLPEYNGYNDQVNPQISNEFSSAAFRMGHTLINSSIIRMDNLGNEIKSGNISLRDAFFNPYVIELAGGIDVYFKGMGTQVQQEFDCKVIDDVRNFLFGAPGAGGLDLAAININRGRERGIPDYNSLRESIGLPKVSSFEAITSSPEDAQEMANVYGSVDNIDAWVGMLAEPHLENGLFGNLVTTILEIQFQALRDGDRFHYRNQNFIASDIEEIENTSMRTVLMRNTDISLMQNEVFQAMPHEQIEGGPSLNPFPLNAAIYPNPVKSQMQIKVYGSIDEELVVSVVDYMGRMVSKTTHHIYPGNNTVIVDLDSCPRGYYNVVLDTEYRMNVLKMIKE